MNVWTRLVLNVLINVWGHWNLAKLVDLMILVRNICYMHILPHLKCASHGRNNTLWNISVSITIQEINNRKQRVLKVGLNYLTVSFCRFYIRLMWKKLHFNHVLTATRIGWHIENSKNYKKKVILLCTRKLDTSPARKQYRSANPVPIACRAALYAARRWRRLDERA